MPQWRKITAKRREQGCPTETVRPGRAMTAAELLVRRPDPGVLVRARRAGAQTTLAAVPLAVIAAATRRAGPGYRPAARPARRRRSE